jgi:peptide/nickel transport system substrate-binding protein
MLFDCSFRLLQGLLFYVWRDHGRIDAMLRSIIFAGVLSAIILSCLNSPPPPDLCRVAVEGSPSTLDPRYAADAYASRILPLIFDNLMEIDASGQVAPGLAESLEMRDDLTYAARIRKGVTFHDGKPLTTRDVVYTFRYLIDPANACPTGSGLEMLASVQAEDERTVVFKLSSPFASFPLKLARPVTPAHIPGKRELADHPVGTGPYRFESFARGSRIVLRAFDDYYGGKPSIERIEFSIIANETTRMLKLRRLDLDLVLNAVPPYSLSFFQKQPDMRVIRQPGINFSYIGFNMRDPKGITSNKLVRRAIAHAIDRDAIIKTLLVGQARKADGPLAPENWAYAPGSVRYDFDPAKAERLLDEAGFKRPAPGKPRFVLSYKTSTDRLRNRIADVMAHQLEQVGIAVEKRSYEWSTFFDDIKKGNFQSFSLTWVGLMDPDIMRYIFHSSMIPPVGANRGRYSNPEVDRLLDRARIENDPQKRKELYVQAQRIIADDCVYVPLWWADDIVVTSKRLEGFKLEPGGVYTSLSKARLR